MQNRYGAAITHVQSGMKILSEVQYNASTGLHQHGALSVSQIPHISIKVLEELFMRLDQQVFKVTLPVHAIPYTNHCR
jgi:hypothetical protein